MERENPTFDVPEEVYENWQEIADILAEVAGIPAALIMRFAGREIEVFVSSESEGNPYEVGQKERFFDSGLYCETVIREQRKLLVPNALEDEDWKDNPDVDLNMISYLGYPLRMPDQTPFGTICVLDSKTNSYSETIEKLMLKFRSLIESHLEMLQVNKTLGDRNKSLSDYVEELQAFRGMVAICANCKSIRDPDDPDRWDPIEKYLIGNPRAEFSHAICPSCSRELYPEHTR